MDVNRFYLFNSIVFNTCFNGSRPILCIDKYNDLLTFFFYINIQYLFLAPNCHLRNRSYSSVFIFIISSWAIPFAIWPCSIFLAHQFSSTKPACVHPANPFIILILCACFYYIPLLFMLVCYSRIIVNIKNIEAMVSN